MINVTYVLSKNGKPLMPCNNAKARLLLKRGKAKVVRTVPFTIKLNYETTEYVQPVIVGVDTGGVNVGYAAFSKKGEILYQSEIILRDDITPKMDQRRKYRQNRRSRKIRYRKARFDNRKNSRKKGRYAPTLISKLHGHIKEIRYIKSILPAKQLVLETGTFDMHLMKNPALANPPIRPWGYQKGMNYGFENTKAQVLNRDNYTCQYCKGKHKDEHLEVHHILFRSNGGSDEADNLITLCHTCHTNLHKGKINIDLKGKSMGNLRYASQMNTIRSMLLQEFPEAIETFGYITKANRQQLGLEKSHATDACVIASQGKEFVTKSPLYIKKCVSKGDFQQTKGIRSQQKINTGKVKGFRKFDKVRYFGKEYFIKGKMTTGYCVLMDIFGKKIDFSNMPKGYKTPKMINLIRVSARKTWMITSVAVIPNIA